MSQNLHQAAKRGDMETVLALLARNVSVDAKDENGWTPLMWAATQGRGEVVKTLLERGADTEVACTKQSGAIGS